MSTRGSSQTGPLGQMALPATCITRASTKATETLAAGRRSLSPNAKKGKPATTGELARKALTDKNCILGDEQTTPCKLYKTFQKILDKFNASLSEDLSLTLHAFAALLQEGASSEQITKKVINAVAQSRWEVPWKRASTS